MGPDSPFVKIGIFIVFAAVVTHFVMQYKNEQDRQVKVTVEAVQKIAAELQNKEGTDVDTVASYITPLHTVSFGNLTKGLEKTGPSVEEYVAAELILLRVYEIDRTASIETHIKLEGGGKNWPWVFDGQSARLEPFEIDKGNEVGPINFLLQMYREQGRPRKPWRQ